MNVYINSAFVVEFKNILNEYFSTTIVFSAK